MRKQEGDGDREVEGDEKKRRNARGDKEKSDIKNMQKKMQMKQKGGYNTRTEAVGKTKLYQGSRRGGEREV